MNTSVGTDNSEDSAHSPDTSPVASPASDAGSITTVASSNTASSTSSHTITACDASETSVPIRATQKNRRSVSVKTKKSKVRMHLSPSSKRPSPERSILKKKSDPAPPPLDPRAFPRLSPSQLPENAIDDDDEEEEDMLPPASLIAVLPVKSKPGSRGSSTSGNMRLPRHPRNLNYKGQDQWQKVPERAPNRPSNPRHDQGLQIDLAGEAHAVGRLLRTQSDTTVPGLRNAQAPPVPANGLHIYGSNPSCNPTGNNILPFSRQPSSRSQPVEYDADKPLLRVVGFEYSPKRSLSDPEFRSSLVVEAMTRSPAIITDEVPRPLFELAPGWGEQPRKAPPSPAESDMRRAAKSQAGQFGEVTMTPFRGKRRARDSVSSGSVDELYLASERAAMRLIFSALPNRFSAERDGSSPCGPRPSSAWRRLGLAAGGAGGWPFEKLRESLPRPKTATGTTTTTTSSWVGDEKQRPVITRAATPLDWRPSTAADSHHHHHHLSRKFREGGFHDRVAHGATKIGSLYRRSSTSHGSGSLIRSAERSPISPLEPIPEVQSSLPSSSNVRIKWADEQRESVEDQEQGEQAREQTCAKSDSIKPDQELQSSTSAPDTTTASRRPSRPFTIDRSGRRPSGGLVARSIAEVQIAEPRGTKFGPLPTAATLLRPVAPPASTASSEAAATPTTTTSSTSPAYTFDSMNPLPALKRAMSDLLPSRPTHAYDALLDNYAPEQPFRIQWRRGSVDGQPMPETTYMASPPIRSRRGSASTLPLSLEPTTSAVAAGPLPGASHPARQYTTESRVIGWLSQQH
ncbi:uncharacterized protein PpBr36_09890 [Pyricularia pennisetigena]|uniref:uncharacterized protein n=1 Tax=Pyricularia pennisetigena TaxID=1578925 RepID=UPI00114E0663|nr:uncharacterized protein PpBr36_09890 [Pyricularia pennisetigena]TLS22547.1 hypothetical protein PpBr36_09890 [Pyricularia pennisetigena]